MLDNSDFWFEVSFIVRLGSRKPDKGRPERVGLPAVEKSVSGSKPELTGLAFFRNEFEGRVRTCAAAAVGLHHLSLLAVRQGGLIGVTADDDVAAVSLKKLPVDQRHLWRRRRHRDDASDSTAKNVDTILMELLHSLKRNSFIFFGSPFSGPETVLGVTRHFARCTLSHNVMPGDVFATAVDDTDNGRQEKTTILHLSTKCTSTKLLFASSRGLKIVFFSLTLSART